MPQQILIDQVRQRNWEKVSCRGTWKTASVALQNSKHYGSWHRMFTDGFWLWDKLTAEETPVICPSPQFN
jgi:hypothetical protein